MAIKPIRFDRGKVLRMALGANGVAVKHGLMKTSSGYLVAAAAGDNTVEYVALETKTDVTGSNGGTFVDVLPLDNHTQFECDLDAAEGAVALIGTHIDIASQTQLDGNASTDDVFHVKEIVSTTKVRGTFNVHGIQS
jgi:hypothetical protein